MSAKTKSLSRVAAGIVVAARQGCSVVSAFANVGMERG